MPDIEVVVDSVKDLRKTEWLSRSDPYVVIKVGQDTRKTETKREGGRNAKFNESLKVPYTGQHQIIFEVFDAETGRDDILVGNGSMDLTPGMNYTGDVQLTTHGSRPEPAGKVAVKVRTP